MRENRISTTLCTDNRLISNTTVTNEYSLAVDKIGLSPKDLKSVAVYGFKRSFFPGNYAEKRRYVRSVIDYYESLEESIWVGEAVRSCKNLKVMFGCRACDKTKGERVALPGFGSRVT